MSRSSRRRRERVTSGARWLFALTLASVAVSPLASCTAVLNLPTAAPEEGPLCNDMIDNDLDGETDCADPSCLASCEGGIDFLPATSGCFRDEELDLAYGTVAAMAGGGQRCEARLVAPDACAGDARFLPGARACRAPGSACGAGVSPADVGGVYVRAGAVGGDGSDEHPFGTIEEALSALDEEPSRFDEDLVLLGPGEFVAPAAITRRVELRGVCPSATRVLGTLRVEASGVSLADVTVQAEDGDAALEVWGDDAHARGVVLVGAVRVDAERGAASLELVDAWVRADHAIGVEAANGGALALAATLIDAGDTGLRSVGGALSLRGVAVRGTTRVGLELRPGDAPHELRGVHLEPRRGVGVDLECGSSTTLCGTLDDVSVDGSRREGVLRGLRIASASVTIRRLYLSQLRGSGLELVGARARLEDSWLETIQDTSVNAGDGIGVRVGADARLDAARVLIYRFGSRGLLIDPHASANVVQLDVIGRGRADGIDSIGIEVSARGQLDALGFRLHDCGYAGLRVDGDGVINQLVEGLIENNACGTLLAAAANPSIGVLTSSVIYRDNDVNLCRGS